MACIYKPEYTNVEKRLKSIIQSKKKRSADVEFPLGLSLNPRQVLGCRLLGKVCRLWWSLIHPKRPNARAFSTKYLKNSQIVHRLEQSFGQGLKSM